MFDLNRLKDKIINDPVLRIFANQATRRRIKAYLVGGYVRDALMGHDAKDADLMIEGNGNAEQIGKLVSEKFGSTLVKFEKHMVVFRITVDGNQYDFADLGESSFSEDQLRRDFTVNSLAVEMGEFVQESDPDVGQIIDVSTGIDDLQNKILRINSESVLEDDPLRVMRLFRFEKQLGFTTDPETLSYIPAHVVKLKNISGERVRDEFFQILIRRGAAETLNRMEDTGILSTLFPYLEETKYVDQNDYHHLNVFDHTIEAINQIENVLDFKDPITSDFKDYLEDFIRQEFVPGRPRYALMKLALLFHDIAKPQTRGEREDGRITFIGHNKLGLEFIEPYLDYLHLSKHETLYINKLVEHHLHPGFLDPDHMSLPKSIFRYYDSHDDIGVDIVLISIADRLAAQGPKVTDEINQRHDRISHVLLDAYFNKNKLLVRPEVVVTGDDIMRELDMAPGREIGILLRIVREGQVTGQVNSFDEAIEYARQFRDNINLEK